MYFHEQCSDLENLVQDAASPFPPTYAQKLTVGVNWSSECCEGGRTCPRMALTRRCWTLSIFLPRSINCNEDILSFDLRICFSKNISKPGLFFLSFPFFPSHGRACALSEICRDCDENRFGFASGIVRGIRRALQTQEEAQEVIMALIRQMQAQSFRKSF